MSKNADKPVAAIVGMPHDIGLTKRELIAAMAMQGSRARPSEYKSWEDMARDCVEIADALLAELERRDD